jgi:formyl-CoA transferase
MDILRNVTVLSLEQATVLPYLTYRLAMDGCRVIAWNILCGDPNRLVGEPFLEGEAHTATLWRLTPARRPSHNLGEPKAKSCRTLDQAPEPGYLRHQPTYRELLKKLGIDYDTLKAVKKDLIWLGITGFGPESNEAAYDPILQARGGLWS